MKGRIDAQQLVRMARQGAAADVDEMMDLLTQDSELRVIKAVDMALGFIESEAGRLRMLHYLFYGSVMQRNYAVNYFRRREEQRPILEAWEHGLVDDIQAFSR
jgi:hypothetical protein